MPPPCKNSKIFCNVRTNKKKAPPVKGAGAAAPEGFAVRGKRQRKLFEKSFLWTPSKTFGQLSPECAACASKAPRQLFSPVAGGFSQPVHRLFHRFSKISAVFRQFSTSGIFTRRRAFCFLSFTRQGTFQNSILLSSTFFQKFRGGLNSVLSLWLSKPLCRYRLSDFFPAFPVFHTTLLFHRLVAKFSQTPRLYTQKPYFQRFSRGV
mgnify:CR=1 FL=1